MAVSSNADDYDRSEGHGKELCLLSLDGGGVRGLSSLCILDELMRKIDPENPPKPCEYFDLIGGTSTGGLIAIMLGRLRMTAGECREAYRELSAEAFESKNYTAAPAWRMPWNWQLQGRFNSPALERGIKKIIVRALRRDPTNDAKSDAELENALLKDPTSKCRVFVTATAESMPDRTSVLTSYESTRWPRDFLDSVTIWQAARATSAASTFFESIQVGPEGEKFLDGATGANNPVNVVWDEAHDIWKCTGPTEDDLQCLVSIGTGVPTVKAFGGSLKSIGETLKNMSTETETTAESFLRRYTRLHDDQRYFRFNVLSGLGDIGLEEATKLALISAATRRYLTSEEPKKQLERCAKNLGFRQWLKDLPRILVRAAEEHLTATANLQNHGQAFREDSAGSGTWLEALPVYQTWLTTGQGPLCYIDSDSTKMSALVSHIVTQDRTTSLSFPPTIYVDCSRYPGSTYQTPMNWALVSIILQGLHVYPYGLHRLRDYFLNSDQSDRWQLRHILDAANLEDQRLLQKLLVGVLGYVVATEDTQALSIIDNANDCQWQGLVRTLSQGLDRPVKHVMILSCNYTAFDGTTGRLPVIDSKVEAKHCISSLQFHEWDQRFTIVEKPLINTTNWVLTHPEVLRWQRESGLLWIKGKPGSGKSSIARMIVERHAFANPELSASTATTKFFYSARLGEKAMHHLYMLRSVLFQLLTQDPSLYSFFTNTYRRLLEIDADWTLRDLMHVFGALVESRSSNVPSIFCVLDAFDESEDNQGFSSDATQVLSWLASLASKPSNHYRLRIIILSRPTNSISRILGSFPSLVVEHNNETDIKRIVRKGLKKIEHSVKNWIKQDCEGLSEDDSNLQSREHDVHRTLKYLETRILEKADGTIQWVVSVLSTLQSQFDRRGVYTQGELEEVIDTLPQGLHELYTELSKRLAKRLTPQELLKARHMLNWVCHAQRPLSLDEFRDALATAGCKEHMTQEQFSQHMLNRRLRLLQAGNWAPVERDIVDMTGCLLEVIKQPRKRYRQKAGVRWWWTSAEDAVQSTHQTVKEFLTETGAGPGPLSLVQVDCRQSLSNSVAAYLRAAVTQMKWAVEVLVKSRQNLQMDQALPPLHKETERAIEHILRYLSEMPLLRYIVVYYGAHLNSSSLQDLLDDQVRNELDCFLGRDKRTIWHETVIHYAFDISCEYGLVSVIQTLLVLCAPSARVLDGALSDIFQRRDLSTFETLLHYAELNHWELSEGKLKGLFSESITRGWDEAFEILLLYEERLFGTHLHTAASVGRNEMVTKLLDRGSKIDQTNTEGLTPLMVAVKAGEVHTAELLLQRGCNPGLKDLAGHTALYYTVFHFDRNTVRALFARGSLEDALKGALDALLDGGYDAEEYAMRLIYGTSRRRKSLPNTLDTSTLTEARRNRTHTFEPKSFDGEAFILSPPPKRHRFDEGSAQSYIRNIGLWKQRTVNLSSCTCTVGPRDQPDVLLRYHIGKNSKTWITGPTHMDPRSSHSRTCDLFGEAKVWEVKKSELSRDSFNGRMQLNRCRSTSDFRAESFAV